MLRIITGNQQEALLAALADRLRMPADADPSSRFVNNPLIPETIVCERGMDRWLWQQLAGRQGIAANLECLLPATFVWKTLAALAPPDAPAPLHPAPLHNAFDSNTLAWRLMRILPALLAHKIPPGGHDVFAPLRHYFPEKGFSEKSFSEKNPVGADADDGDRKLYALCRRLADTFDNYLVYRPQLIAAWDAGRHGTAHPATEHWQAALWQALLAEGGSTHRVALMQRFCAADDQHRQQNTVFNRRLLPARISVFGIPALPPAYVDILGRLAHHTQLDLYVLSPSRAFWGDILSPAAMARIERQTGYAFDIPNRLLAANGQPVRHFLSELAGREAEQIDVFVEPDRRRLLGKIQADILDLTETRGINSDRIDNSVQIVSAYGALREVEILHDNLLAMFNADPALTPRDVLVMAPDISVFAPAITAVFGAAEGKRQIPFALADVPPRGTHPLMVAFETLLHLPDSRLTVNDVLALLDIPAIAAQWQFDDGDLALIRTALHEANVRWGLDAAARARAGLPAEQTHTWQFAFARLFMGLAVGDDDSHALVLGVAPCAVFEGKNAVVLGRLQDFIDQLALWQQRLSMPQHADSWADSVSALTEAFFAPADNSDELALDTIVAAARHFRDETAAAAFSDALSPVVFRDDFLARLGAATTRGNFLTGAVTCCQMMPMRSLPFKVIALLGMNGDAFPRRQGKGSFDLIDLAPQPGDRARRLDDRHLFLEILLSAREQLYISYSGRSARDDSVREPSVLVGELIDTVVAMCGSSNAGHSSETTPRQQESMRQQVRRQLVVEHPLQSFSRRYFDGSDATLFSFDDAGLVAARSRHNHAAQRSTPDTPWQFCAAPLPTTDEANAPASLSALIRFFNHPVRAFLRDRLDIPIFRGNDTLSDDEPFDIDGLAAYQLTEDRLATRINSDGGDDAQSWRALLRARGDLPVGALADVALARQQATVDALHARIAPHLAGLHDVRVALNINGRPLTGLLRNVSTAGVLHYSAASLKGKRMLSLWLEHLVLCAGHDGTQDNIAALRSLLITRDQTWQLAPIAADAAKMHLAHLIAIYDAGMRAPLRLFPETSFAWATAKKSPADAAHAAWYGTGYIGAPPGEAEDPAHRIVFGTIADVLDAQFAELAERVWKPVLDNTVAGGQDDA